MKVILFSFSFLIMLRGVHLILIHSVELSPKYMDLIYIWTSLTSNFNKYTEFP